MPNVDIAFFGFDIIAIYPEELIADGGDYNKEALSRDAPCAQVRAAQDGRSTEAPVRAILDEATRAAGRDKVGSALVDAFRPFGGVDNEVRRDRSPAAGIEIIDPWALFQSLKLRDYPAIRTICILAPPPI